MQKLITAHNATVQTMTVDVKVMRIDKRQVTLAVFRQLQDEDVIDPATGKLNGIPWGIVNHHTASIGCDEIGCKHLHVIWQKGDELRRAIVAPWDSLEIHNPMLDMYAGRKVWHWRKVAGKAASAAVDAEYVFPRKVQKAPKAMNESEAAIERALTEIELRFGNGERAEASVQTSVRDMTDEALEKFRALLKAIGESWQQSYDQITLLDQLFIAV